MSNIRDIKPHEKPEEYIFEDEPNPPTDRNRVSAIFMNWVKNELVSNKVKTLESYMGSGVKYLKKSNNQFIVYAELTGVNLSSGYATIKIPFEISAVIDIQISMSGNANRIVNPFFSSRSGRDIAIGFYNVETKTMASQVSCFVQITGIY